MALLLLVVVVMLLCIVFARCWFCYHPFSPIFSHFAFVVVVFLSLHSGRFFNCHHKSMDLMW